MYGSRYAGHFYKGPRPKVETLQDDFANGLDHGKWSSAVSVVVESEQAKFNIGSDVTRYLTSMPFDCANSSIFANVTNFANTNMWSGEYFRMSIEVPDANQSSIRFGYEWAGEDGVPGELHMTIKEGTVTYQSGYYSLAPWWKITTSGTTISWHSSPDNVTWTQLCSTTSSLSLTECRIKFEGFGFAVGDIYLDNVNITVGASQAELWNGTSWQTGIEVWNGTSWRTDAEIWNGASWVPA